MKKIFVALVFACLLFAREIHPTHTLKTPFEVSSIQREKDLLYISTLGGEVLIYHLNQKKYRPSIKLPLLRDFFGNSYPPKIFNTASNSKNMLAIVSANAQGKRNLYLADGNHPSHPPTPLLTDLNIAKVLWLNEEQILIALLSHEILLYDLPRHQTLYQTQISQSSFSDMVLDSPFLFTTGESGVVYQIHPKNGKILKTLPIINKDKNFQIVANHHRIATAGQDRRVGVYFLDTGKDLSLRSDFLVYAVGLDAPTNTLAYLANEKGDIALVNLLSKKKTAMLTGLQGIANNIIFYKNNIIVSCDSPYIYFFNKGEL
ncbi:WD40 repeat domain-containing protein [Helicobacter mustelae]|uniref:Putative periplasmic protein NapL n=1 Tax=Helicobacter mustelae (strain ATCC 43772 / CCUG 25715 / CIP 103759 / LMG 18044 / NCTC 12198 / R85-136P) TaxID=679897 RepID=D3UIP4_HELM1|nr:hypothetical protein [Helicobacter mustelae]CBG40369.1 putative periplasmic protein NapL [Helicobacter mustelae 12198]SQH71868.1 periplasmic nitrate reductase component NapL [Helicobacter mustelae]STP13007.1 periplasmic nitrate reductase component NapL [Helicobacter mustelae]